MPRWKRLLFWSLLVLGVLGVLETILASSGAVILWLRAGQTFSPTYAERPIFCMGDSVPFGWRLTPAEAFPAQLQTALRAAGQSQATVINTAIPGSTAASVRIEQFPTLERLPSAFGTDVLLMVGHNDLLERGILYSPRDSKAARFETQTSSPWYFWERLRLLKMLRWFWYEWETPPAAPVLNQDKARGFLRGLEVLAQLTQARGAHLILLTYPVPGEPPGGMDPGLASSIRYTKTLQTQVNGLVRQAAAAHKTRLVDLEKQVSVGKTWDPVDFIDSIHPTAEVHRQIAGILARALLLGPRPSPIQ